MVLSADRVFKADLFFFFLTAAASKALHDVVFFAWFLRAWPAAAVCLPRWLAGWASWFPVICSQEQTAVLVRKVPEPTTTEWQS